MANNLKAKKQKLIKELMETLLPGESITIQKHDKLESLTDNELHHIFEDYPGNQEESLRAVVMADRKREIELLRERWSDKWQTVHWTSVAGYLGVDLES